MAIEFESEMRERISELLKVSRAARREDLERADLFEPMVRSEAWKSYRELVNRRLQLFSDQLLAPAGGSDGLIAQEYIKGAMFGICLCRDLPSHIIESMKGLRSGADAEEEEGPDAA